MNEERLVCVDWGTSRLRAVLCRSTDGILDPLDTIEGKGVLEARNRIESELFETIAPWTRRYGALPLLLAGMVGSNIGWRNVPYVRCPVAAHVIVDHGFRFSSSGHEVVIVPGLECVNSQGHPDFMRGEELQVLGWLAADARHGSGEHLVCLPGTHTKWVHVQHGIVDWFQTALTGELYSLLSRHSVLLAADQQAGHELKFNDTAFSEGVAAAATAADQFTHLLFSTRSRILKGEFDAGTAGSYLSGLLIGADVVAACGRGRVERDRKVAIVSEPALCLLFSTALRQLGYQPAVLDGALASLKGFERVFGSLRHTGDVECSSG